MKCRCRLGGGGIESVAVCLDVSPTSFTRGGPVNTKQLRGRRSIPSSLLCMTCLMLMMSGSSQAQQTYSQPDYSQQSTYPAVPMSGESPYPTQQQPASGQPSPYPSDPNTRQGGGLNRRVTPQILPSNRPTRTHPIPASPTPKQPTPRPARNNRVINNRATRSPGCRHSHPIQCSRRFGHPLKRYNLLPRNRVFPPGRRGHAASNCPPTAARSI